MTDRPRVAHPRLVALSTPGEDDSPPDLETLYRAHADFVWRTLRRMGVEDDVLEDLVHAVFLVVRSRLPTYEGRSAATTWLYGIARHVAANHRRSAARRRQREHTHAPLPATANPDEEMSRRRALALVEAFVLTLPLAQRRVFELADLEGFSGPEVAEALAIPLNTVYSRLRSARHRFEAFLEERS